MPAIRVYGRGSELPLHPTTKGREMQTVDPQTEWTPVYSTWRHGGWYVDNVRYPSGAVGCVSRNYADGMWRIVCDERDGDYTYPTRDAAARAERDLAAAKTNDPEGHDMAETTTTLDDIAREAYGWFETARRATGDTDMGPREDGEEYTRLRDGAPQWITDMVYDAHGDMFPDDWKYDAIRSALGAIADDGYDEDDGAHEWADNYVDIYTAARYAWLASNLNRAGYIEEAVSEGLAGDTQNVAELAGIGQYMEAREVFESVVSSLTAEVDARGEEV